MNWFLCRLDIDVDMTGVGAMVRQTKDKLLRLHLCLNVKVGSNID